ncbi:MAG: sulfur transferase domain-containing protein [Planctomycetota bacterium]
MKPLSALLLAGLLAIAPGCSGEAAPTSDSGATDALDPSGPASLGTTSLGGPTTLHAFEGRLVSAQPTEAELKAGAERGLASVVNFRRPSEAVDFDERAAVEAAGMDYVAVPWNGVEELDDALLDRGRELLRDLPRPALFHCKSGNRVGPMWIAWRVLDEGADFEAAEKEARAMGLSTDAYVERVRRYVDERAR